jgi:hypothetical protein
LCLPYPDAVKVFKYLVWHKAILVDLAIPMLLTSQAPTMQIASAITVPEKRAA